MSQEVIQEVSAEDLQKIDDLIMNKVIKVPPRMASGIHDDFIDAVTYGVTILRPKYCGIIGNINP